MRKNKLIYLAFLLLPGFISCVDDDNDKPDIDTGDGQVHLKATVVKNSILTRADENFEPAADGDYYLYCTKVGDTSLTPHEFNRSTKNVEGVTTITWTASPKLYWDDIEEAKPDKGDTEFYLSNMKLTNMEDMTFLSKAMNKDILFGKTTGWNKELDFTLNHLTSKITVIVYDNTLEGNVNFKNAKVVFYPGLNRTTTGIDYITGTIKSLDTDKDITTTINEFKEKTVEKTNAENNIITHNGIENTNPLYIVPQEFTGKDSLEVTAGKYVYRIPLPTPTGDTFNLLAGEHLIIEVELSEDDIKSSARLINWEDKNAGEIEISRVFNIASWPELRDLAQAVATGYTFKGMVVRLNADIELQDQISLGTKEHPFEGVFGGGGHRIKNLGLQGTMQRNKGGLFAYTSGATIQNLTLVEPYVESDGKNPVGALIDNAVNTTVFNCRTESVGSNSGVVYGGTVDKVGGLIGAATGTSTLINCYSYVRVEGEGEFIGGLIGYSEASITHCFAKGEVDCVGATHVGGLAGHMEGSMHYCYAQGNVTGSSKIGGLIGHLDGKINQCYASGQVTGPLGQVDEIEAGGLVSCLGFEAEVESCFWHSWNVNGSGSATLPGSCKPFATGATLLGYLDNQTGIWKVQGDNYPEFANQ